MSVEGMLQACYQACSQGDIGAAEKQYHALLKVPAIPARSIAAAHHIGALIGIAAKQYAIAQTRIDAALSAVPLHHEYLNTQGSIYAHLQEYQLAVKAYESSLIAKPDYVKAANDLGKLCIDNKDVVRAVEIYDTALKQTPNDVQLQIGRIIALNESIRSEEALKALDALEQETRKKYDYLRGQIYLQLSRYEDAIQSFLAGLKNSHTASHALKNVLQVFWMTQRWDEAERIIVDVLAKPDIGMIMVVVRSYCNMGDMESARKTIDDGVRHFGDNPYLLSERARLNLKMSNVEVAYNDAMQAMQIAHGDLTLMECFADCALASGHPNEALMCAGEAMKQLPNNQYWLAIIYMAKRALGQDYHYYADYDRYIRAYDLKPPQGYDTIEAFNLALRQALGGLHEFSEHPLDLTLRQGSQTLLDLRFVDNDVVQGFFKMIDEPIRAYMREMGEDDQHPLMRRNTNEYRVTGAWSVRLKKDGFHVNHIHPDGWISSSYYVDVPSEIFDGDDKSGWIHFGEPPIEIKDSNGLVLGPEKYVQPKNGRLVLFPSYFWHGTVALTKDEKRMTLPFDVVPA